MTDNLLLCEAIFVKKMITEIVPTGFVSLVFDTYDYWAGLTKLLPLPGIKKLIMERDGRLVIRPDSGNPIHIICGYKIFPVEFETEVAFETYVNSYGMYAISDYEVVRVDNKYYDLKSLNMFERMKELPEHEALGSIRVLWNIFGGTLTDLGFKTLDTHIGLIYGDSITLERQWEILQRLHDMGFSSANVVLGIGSYTYNYSTRDTFGSAVKATATVVDGEYIELFKDPKTGDALKKSAKGLLRVEEENGEFVLHDQQELSDIDNLGAMEILFHNGQVAEASLSEIRQRLIG